MPGVRFELTTKIASIFYSTKLSYPNFLYKKYYNKYIIIFYAFVIKYFLYNILLFFLYLRNVDTPIPKYLAAYILLGKYFPVFVSIFIIFTGEEFINESLFFCFYSVSFSKEKAFFSQSQFGNYFHFFYKFSWIYTIFWSNTYQLLSFFRLFST